VCNRDCTSAESDQITVIDIKKHISTLTSSTVSTVAADSAITIACSQSGAASITNISTVSFPELNGTSFLSYCYDIGFTDSICTRPEVFGTYHVRVAVTNGT
jgi:hypothetical protein